jgi:hypothetical protein
LAPLSGIQGVKALLSAIEGIAVETVWDWLTVFCFAGLVTLMLQRSSEEVLRDKLWHYAPPALGCAVANYLGNEGMHIPAALLLAGVIVYIFVVLKVRLPKF